MQGIKENVYLKNRRAPPVKQTITSKLRMLKANPLLMYELNKKLNQDLIKQGEEGKLIQPLTKLVPLLDLANGENQRKSQPKPLKHVQKPQKPILHTIVNKKVETPVKRSVIQQQMMEKLNQWLKIKRKHNQKYKHLKCFGIDNITSGNNNMCKEDLPIDETQLAKDALLDLLKLIKEGYCTTQCETWLKLIKQKCIKVDEGFEYWECRAALEQYKGNMEQAIECYKNAIIQGAELKNVDKRLDQLLHKFNLLNIENKQPSNNILKKRETEEARNIFKSSIIQFAVQERTTKKKIDTGFTVEKVMIATPVRRSTRMSRSVFNSSSRIQLYTTLEDVDHSVRQTLNFQCNNALKEN